EISINMTRVRLRAEVHAKAEVLAEERLLDALVGESAGEETRQKFREKLRKNQLDDREVSIELQDTSNSQMPTIDIPGLPGAQMGMINLSDVLGRSGPPRTIERKVPIKEAYELLVGEEGDKLLDQDKVINEALRSVEENGIVFIDEIDKISARGEAGGPDVSREGVQRDLLPLIEGTMVSTKHGTVKTDHILFIASGAFHTAKPSDLLPELQGRLPNRVELKALSADDFVRILVEPETNLICQYQALLETEGVELIFKDDAIREMADLAAQVNQNVENIGARRLHTVIEKLLEEISFEASEKRGEKVVITAEYVQRSVGYLAKNSDLSKFIL
ncbi:MAG: ATP-dependent protease ATPase subunit HslU, partial [Alphaproteobacteria bacterium]|nr:ATP-dependent protease ATPase subunit HslU [Alphaproteobacteria bacterium]